MKGKYIISMSFLFLVIFICNASSEITGEAITGEATSQQVGMSISLFVPLPTINIIKPENETYLNNQTIILNYTTQTAINVWYNIDNGNNITLTGNTYFSTSQGSHTLYMHANNSKGESSENITFFVNSTRFNIIGTEYEGAKKGESINFSLFSYEDLQELDNIILENIDYGKIEFNEEINMTEDIDISDNQIDLDSHTNISQNRIEINSTALPNFNKSATISIYNLNFTIPRILKDGVECPSSICSGASYSAVYDYGNDSYYDGLLVFDVTEFSVYSVEETPDDEETTVIISGGGGGGGGSSNTVPAEFNVTPEEIILKLSQGDIISKEILIKNTGNRKSLFFVDTSEMFNSLLQTSSINSIINLSDDVFELNPGETKRVNLQFTLDIDTFPDLYLGRVDVISKGTKKSVFIALEVESKETPFNVTVKIPNKYKQVFRGGEVLAYLEIINFDEIKKENVIVEWTIKNDDSEIIVSENESLSFEKGISSYKLLQLPEDIEYGNYVLYVRAVHEGKDVASSSQWFSVIVYAEPSKDKTIMIYVVLILLLLLLFLIIIIAEIRNRKKKIKKNKNRNHK